jgi:hypothetical protein
VAAGMYFVFKCPTPVPIQQYERGRDSFASCARRVRALLKKGIDPNKEDLLDGQLASYGVAHIYVNDNCVFFTFSSLAPDATETIGCCLDESRAPGSAIYSHPAVATREFRVIDAHWFYWRY